MEMKQRKGSKNKVSRELTAPQSLGGCWEEQRKEMKDYVGCPAEEHCAGLGAAWWRKEGPSARHGDVSLLVLMLGFLVCKHVLSCLDMGQWCRNPLLCSQLASSVWEVDHYLFKAPQGLSACGSTDRSCLVESGVQGACCRDRIIGCVPVAVWHSRDLQGPGCWDAIAHPEAVLTILKYTHGFAHPF